MEKDVKKLINTLPEHYRINVNVLDEKIKEFNEKNNTKIEITHNGLELWIEFGDNKSINRDIFDSVYELVANNGFSKRFIYGNKHIGICLGPPDYDSNQLKLNL